MAVYPPHPAVVVKEHDGDTVTLDVSLDFGVTIRIDCRTYGDNAPELGTPEGAKALADLVALMPLGAAVTVTNHGKEKYGRYLGDITLPDGTHLTADMIAAGDALPYFGKGPKPV